MHGYCFYHMCILVCVFSSSFMTRLSHISFMPFSSIAVIQGSFNSGIPFCFVSFGCRIEWKSKFAETMIQKPNQV